VGIIHFRSITFQRYPYLWLRLYTFFLLCRSKERRSIQCGVGRYPTLNKYPRSFVTSRVGLDALPMVGPTLVNAFYVVHTTSLPLVTTVFMHSPIAGVIPSCLSDNVLRAFHVLSVGFSSREKGLHQSDAFWRMVAPGRRGVQITQMVILGSLGWTWRHYTLPWSMSGYSPIWVSSDLCCPNLDTSQFASWVGFSPLRRADIDRFWTLMVRGTPFPFTCPSWRTSWTTRWCNWASLSAGCIAGKGLDPYRTSSQIILLEGRGSSPTQKLLR